MDVNIIVELIKSTGFPIVVCLLLFWYIYKMLENHKLEAEKFTEALNNNTLVMQKLVDKLSGE